MDSPSEKDIEALLAQTVEENRREWRDWIAQNASSVVRQHRADRVGFELRLQARWHDVLERLDFIQWWCVDLGQEAKLRYVESDRDQGHLGRALFKLHAQSCLIGSEVIALLRSGHSSGAMARWRSLHETVAVLSFIKENGEDVAQRYFLHNIVQSRDAAREYQKHCDKLGYEPFTEEEMESMESQYRRLKDQFGKPFADSDYGWAQRALFGDDSKQNASFSWIEKQAGLDHLRPFYRMAGHSVHANPKSLSAQIGLIDSESVLLAGPSNYGLADPGQATANSLALSTVSILTYVGDIDFLAVSQELMDLAKATNEMFVATQKQIEQEEEDEASSNDA
ncbi:MAG: DUF5677 domain-containing protein [Rhodothermales bacterium]